MDTNVGHMIKSVKNRDSPVNTEFGGIDWVCIAFLKKLKTMTILVNEVTITRIEGAIERTVIRRTISRV